MANQVDIKFQHFTTTWLLTGWPLIVFVLDLILMNRYGWVVKIAVISWLLAIATLQGKFSSEVSEWCCEE